MPTLYVAPTANFVSTTLNGAVNDSTQTITLNSTANMQAPGYIVIDRTDGAGISTPLLREVVTFTGIAGNDLTGCTRGADNSTARSHSNNAIVETMPTVGLFNSLATILASGLDSSGYLRAINSPVSIARGEFTQFVTPSIASIAQAQITRLFASGVTISTSINLSGASIVGISSGTGGFNAILQMPGSLPTTLTDGMGYVIVPTSFTGQFMNLAVKTPASTASIFVTVKKYPSTVYGVISMIAGATFASSASIGTPALVAGDILIADLNSNFLAQDLQLLVRAT